LNKNGGVLHRYQHLRYMYGDKRQIVSVCSKPCINTTPGLKKSTKTTYLTFY